MRGAGVHNRAGAGAVLRSSQRPARQRDGKELIRAQGGVVPLRPADDIIQITALEERESMKNDRDSVWVENANIPNWKKWWDLFF